MLRDLACEGIVLHRRCAPVGHEFRYPVWMLWLDVDDVQHPASRLFSMSRRPAPLAVRPQDYPRDPLTRRTPLGQVPPGGIRGAVNGRLASHGCRPADRVFVLTQPRSWGWLFNPVTFYFCFREESLICVVAEITNTPWDEVHSYVLPVDGPNTGAAAGGGQWEFAFPKRFHVSPFLPMDLDYRWRVKISPESLEIAMHLFREERETFFAGMYLQPRPLTARALRRGALRCPLQNLVTLARSYWQAFRLWRRGAAFHAHPGSLKEAESS